MTTQSIIAAIPGTTSAAAVQEAQTVAAKKSLKTGAGITGSYLFKQFVEVGKAELTKMQIVESAAVSVPVTAFNSALKDMVALAKDKGDATLKTARNHAAVLRNIYGALTQRGTKFSKVYQPGKTGYHQANALAKDLLKSEGIRWDGSKALTPDQRNAQRVARAEEQAFKEAAKETHRKDGESLPDYTARVAELAQGKVESKLEELTAARVEKLADAIKKMCGDDLMAVIDHLMATAE